MRRRELGDHAIGCGALLTARKPTANQQLTNCRSIRRSPTRRRAARGIALAAARNAQLADRPTSFGTYYTRSISWRGPSTTNADGTCRYPTGTATPLGKEIDAKKAFDRLFAGTDSGTSAAEAEKRRALRQSVLDAVVPHGDWLRDEAQHRRPRQGRRAVHRHPRRSSRRSRQTADAAGRVHAAGRARNRPRFRQAARLHAQPDGDRVPVRHHARHHLHDERRAQQSEPVVHPGGRRAGGHATRAITRSRTIPGDAELVAQVPRDGAVEDGPDRRLPAQAQDD